MTRELIVGLLMLIGVLFSLLAGVGIVRMPDFLTRLQASTKAGTLGVMCIMIGISIWYEDFGVIVRALLVVVFLFLTAPVAAHLISRAAYRAGAKTWDGTVRDELQGHYDHGETATGPSGGDDAQPHL